MEITNEICDIQKLQARIEKWCDDSFGQYRISTSIIHNLKPEIDKLNKDLKSLHQGVYSYDNEIALKILREKKDKILNGLAECFMLLFDAAAREQINIQMLYDTIDKKINT